MICTLDERKCQDEGIKHCKVCGFNQDNEEKIKNSPIAKIGDLLTRTVVWEERSVKDESVQGI